MTLEKDSLRDLLRRVERLELDVAGHPLIGTVVAVESSTSRMVSVRLDTMGDEEGAVLSDVLWCSGQEFGGVRIRFSKPMLGARVLVEQGAGRFSGVEWVIGGVVATSDRASIAEFATDISAITGIADPEVLDVAREGAFVIGIGKSDASETRDEGAYLVIEDRRLRLIVEGDFDDGGTLKHGRNVVEITPQRTTFTAPSRNQQVTDPAQNV